LVEQSFILVRQGCPQRGEDRVPVVRVLQELVKDLGPWPPRRPWRFAIFAEGGRGAGYTNGTSGGPFSGTAESRGRIIPRNTRWCRRIRARPPHGRTRRSP